MPTTIFYAWQSDTDESVCHYLIRDALEAAIKLLKSDAKVQEAETFSDMRVLYGTEGEPGTPNIPMTIQRRIRDCDIFVGDVTTNTSYLTADGRTKAGQNGNVMVETGLALARKGTKRVLLVMNEAFGKFDKLPFDLHLYRKPTTYTLPAGSDKKTRDAMTAELGKVLSRKLKAILDHIESRKATSEAALRTARSEGGYERAEALRSELEQRVRDGRFHFFRPTSPMLTLCMVALDAATEQVDLTDERSLTPWLTPIGGSQFNHGHDAKHFYMFTQYPTDDPAWSKKYISTSITAVRADGVAMAAHAINTEAVPWHQGAKGFRWRRVEPMAVKKVIDFLRLMREHGVSGPVLVGVSLLNVGAMYIHLDDSGWVDDQVPIADEDVRPAFVELSADLDGKDRQAVARALRSRLREIWRSGGWPDCYNFDEQGNYVMRIS